MSERPVSRRDVARLRGVQGLLALLVCAWIPMGASERYWPVVGWPMYDVLQPPPPPDHASQVYLRVRLRDGGRRVLRQADLVEYSRAPIAGMSINALLDRNDSARRATGRQHLTALVARALGTDQLDSIVLTQVTWSVALDRVPPVNLAQPVSTVPLAEFAVPR